ncbi:MAG TPA: metalloregulator ArsR/SmtB family transcription factor [Bacteroidota bacterium]|jgi:DNA-binding transcriptional ArsR family regulator
MNDTLTSIKAVSEEIRVRLLLLLMDREACVCELMSVYQMAQSKLSHHLITLRDAGLLQDEKRGKWNYYRVNTRSLTSPNRELLSSLSRWFIDEEILGRDRRTLDKVKEQMGICC